jgi:60 kDa SS-A/Ro ribonucleoprotein
MSTQFAKHLAQTTVRGVQVTSPTKIIPGREAEMAFNNAGGAVFTISCFDHLLRFLILGTEGGTYSADEKNHTYQAFEGLKECIRQDAQKTVDLIVDVSKSGRAAKNDPALFALAAVMALAESPEDKFYARTKLTEVARIGTHLFHFAQFVDTLKGWGTGTRKAFQQWYLSKTPEEIAFQFVKYGQRDGWSHRDILRKAHPVTDNEHLKALFDVMAHPDHLGKYRGPMGIETMVPSVVWGANFIKQPNLSLDEVVAAIKEYRLPREAIPTEYLNSTKVWEVLLPNMKPEAMIRNLGKLTSLGMLAPMGDWAKFVAETLTNDQKLKNARIHPLNVYTAFRTYASGKGLKGSLAWTPTNTVSDALEAAFVKSFNFVEPSGKNILLALDVSGSMTTNKMSGSNLNCREGSAVMAMVTAKTEPNYHMMAFSGGFIPLDIRKTDSLREVQIKISGLPFERTDCSLPMQYAAKNNIPVDCFQVYTDNETWAGSIQPAQALRLYRNKMNLPKSKLAVVAMTATKFSIADPKDPYMQDFVGFDSSAPQAMAELAKM